MEPVTVGILTSLATGYFTHFTADHIKSFFESAIRKKPDIEKKLQSANTTEKIEEVFKEATGVIDASANTSEIKVYGALIEAIKGIRFNHEHGTVTIQGAKLQAPVIVTGGRKGSTGSTRLGENTVLNSTGTSISIGEGCGIYLGGDSSIRQN